MDFFTSDLHFGHKDVIRFCDRPFSTLQEMNESLIERWNSTVTDRDKVFVVGDVFLCDIEEGTHYINQLNGYKILIKGNHDHSPSTMIRSGFDECHPKFRYTMPDNRVALLQHYPMPDILIKDEYDLQIHGHIHLGKRTRGKKINVSCDIWDYSPVPIDTLNSISLSDNSENEKFEMSITDDGDICSSFKVDVEDFSGVADVIYKAMGKKWPNRRRK